jgi:hypothetical protein
LISAPPGAFGERYVAALRVTTRQASDAQAFVWQSLEKQSEDGSVKSYAPGPYEGSVFFDATPKYSAIHTCNTWAAEVLAAGALPIRSAGVVFAGQLWKKVRSLEAQRQGGLLSSSQTTVVPEF